MLSTESDLGLGPSSAGQQMEIPLRCMSSLAASLSLSPLSFSRAHPAATLFVLRKDKSHLCDETLSQCSWRQHRLSGAAGSGHRALSRCTALPAGAGSPAAGRGARAKGAPGARSVAATHSGHTATLLPGWPGGEDTCPQRLH